MKHNCRYIFKHRLPHILNGQKSDKKKCFAFHFGALKCPLGKERIPVEGSLKYDAMVVFDVTLLGVTSVLCCISARILFWMVSALIQFTNWRCLLNMTASEWNACWHSLCFLVHSPSFRSSGWVSWASKEVGSPGASSPGEGGSLEASELPPSPVCCTLLRARAKQRSSLVGLYWPGEQRQQ